MASEPSTLKREVRGIAGHGLVYMLAALASRCIGFLMIPVYTSEELGNIRPADYGVLEMLDLVVQVTGMVFALGLANAAMRFHAAAEDEEARRRVVGTAQIASIALALLGSLLIVALARPLASELLDGRPQRLLWYVAGSTLGAGMAGTPLAYLRIRGRSIAYTVVSLGQLVSALTLNVVLVVVLEMGAEGVVLSGLVTQLFWGSVLTAMLLREVGLGFDGPTFRRLARYGAPLLLSALGTFLMTSGDRYIVKRWGGLDEVGLYGLGYKLGFLVQVLLVGPFFLVWQPRSFAIEKDPEARAVYARVFTYFMAALLFGAAAVSALARDAVRLMAAPDYHAAHRFVPWIAFACAFNGVQVYCRIGIYLRNRTELAGAIMLGMALLALAAAVPATIAHGAMGAAVVSFASYGILAAGMALAARRLYAVPYEAGRLAKLALCVAAVLLAARANPFEPLAPSLAWNALACALFPALLLLLRFFHAGERRWIGERLALLRARLARAAAPGGPGG